MARSSFLFFFFTCQVSIDTTILVSPFLLQAINLPIILSYYRKVQIFFLKTYTYYAAAERRLHINGKG